MSFLAHQQCMPDRSDGIAGQGDWRRQTPL